MSKCTCLVLSFLVLSCGPNLRECFEHYPIALPDYVLILLLPDLRVQDPDNDYRSRLNSVGLKGYKDHTNNYVLHQRGYPAYEHPTIPGAAVVCACGAVDFASLVCLGSVHPTAGVSFGGLNFNFAADVYGAYGQVWKSYGGKDMLNLAEYGSRMHYFDETLAGSVSIGTLAPGDVSTFTFMSVMHSDQMSKALSTVSAVTIVQPTDIMSGSASPFTVGK